MATLDLRVERGGCWCYCMETAFKNRHVEHLMANEFTSKIE